MNKPSLDWISNQSRETSNQPVSAMTFELENPVAIVPNLIYYCYTQLVFCNPIVLLWVETKSTDSVLSCQILKNWVKRTNTDLNLMVL